MSRFGGHVQIISHMFGMSQIIELISSKCSMCKTCSRTAWFWARSPCTTSGGGSTQTFCLSQNSNTTVQKYSVTSPAFKILLKYKSMSIKNILKVQKVNAGLLIMHNVHFRLMYITSLDYNH